VVWPILWPDYVSGLNMGLGIKFGMNLGFFGDAKLMYTPKPEPGTYGGYTPNGNPILPTYYWYDYFQGAFDLTAPVDWLGRLSSVGFNADNMYGISTIRASLTKTFRPDYWQLGATHSATFFVEDQRLEVPWPYYGYPTWHPFWGGWNDFYGDQTDVAGFHYSIVSEGHSTHFDLFGETSVWGSDASFARTEAVFKSMLTLGAGMNLNIRAATGTATAGTPYQRMFFLSRADIYEEQNDGFYRAVSGISEPFSQNTSIFLDGGAGVRGYNAGNAAENIYGDEMAGLNLDLNLPNPLSNVWGLSSITPGVFADAGWIENDVIRGDGGIKFAVNILSWLPSQLQGVAQEYDKIPTINVDFPLYENEPLDGKKQFAFRWALSMGAAF
jgi:hypothetical protein